MARPLRIVYEGAVYHITVRGHSRSLVFEDDSDRRRFLARLAYDVGELGIRLYAYCLMSNHYHLVVETPLANVSEFMQNLQTSYHLYYNRRHRRSGQVSQGRFKAKVLEGDEYLLKLTRYVHLNAVQTKAMKKLGVKERIKKLRAYRWSSYRAYTGRARREKFVEHGPMRALLRSYGFVGSNGYGRFVEAGLAEDDEEFFEIMKASPYAIGSEGFVEQVKGIYDVLAHTRYKHEDAALRNVGKRLEPERVLKTVAKALDLETKEFLNRRRNSWNRAIAVKMLCRFAGYSRRDAAEYLRMGSGAAASMQLKELEGAREKDRALQKLVREVKNECGKLIT